MNSTTRLLFLFLSLPLVNANAADVPLVLQQGNKGYAGTHDVSINAGENLASQNFGGTHQIDIWQFEGVLLVRFDLAAIPRDAVIKNASLELFCSAVGFAPEEKARAWPVGVYECTHSWKEGTGIPNERPERDGATLKTFNGIRPWPNGKVTSVAGELLGTTTHEGDQQRWYKWDLKPDVIQQWVSGSRPNNGFMVWGKPPGKAVSFTSKDSTAPHLRPILRMTVSLPDSDVGKLAGLSRSDIAWNQFVADCGMKAQEANQARTEQVFDERYVDRTVNWTGTVVSTQRNLVGRGYSVSILMDPTESAFGTYDLLLSARESLTDRILSLNKGQLVDFTARFSRQGGTILGHNLDLLAIEPAKPREQPQRKGGNPPRRNLGR